MALSWADLEQRVRKLSHEYRDRGDRVYSVVCDCGVLLGTTKVGRHRGKKKDVGHAVLKQIPRQLKVDTAVWQDIVACTSDRSSYIRARGHGRCIATMNTPPRAVTTS